MKPDSGKPPASARTPQLVRLADFTRPQCTAGVEGPTARRRALLPEPGPARARANPVAPRSIESRSLGAPTRARALAVARAGTWPHRGDRPPRKPLAEGGLTWRAGNRHPPPASARRRPITYDLCWIGFDWPRSGASSIQQTAFCQ